VGQRDDRRAGAEHLLAAGAAAVQLEARLAPLEALGAPAEADLDPCPLQCRSGRIADDLLQRPDVKADVTGIGPRQQPGPEDERGQRQRGIRRAQVERGQGDQVPERIDGLGVLSVALEPAAERCPGASARAPRGPPRGAGGCSGTDSARARRRGAAVRAARLVGASQAPARG
jgi:hypothetical protein